MKRKLLVIDTETGGLDPARHAILQVGIVLLHDGAIEDTFSSYVCGDPGELDEGALKVNGLTRLTVEAEGQPPSAIVARIEAMLQKHDMRQKVTVAGANVAFDVGFMRRLYSLGGSNWDDRFSHRVLDVQSAALMLEQAGRLTLPGGSASLSSLASLFGIVPGTAHNAIDDAHTTVAVLNRLLRLLRH